MAPVHYITTIHNIIKFPRYFFLHEHDTQHAQNGCISKSKSFFAYIY